MERMWILFASLAGTALCLWLALSGSSRRQAARLTYRLVCTMEQQLTGPGRGAERKAMVIRLLHARLPQWTQVFLSEQELDTLIELAVRKMKELLAQHGTVPGKE